MRLRIKECSLANQEHEVVKRWYAHAFHFKDTICIADDFWNLPEHNQIAIILHETGHYLVGERGSERQANEAIERETGIHIYYKDSKYGKYLEWIPPRNKDKAKEFLGI